MNNREATPTKKKEKWNKSCSEAGYLNHPPPLGTPEHGPHNARHLTTAGTVTLRGGEKAVSSRTGKNAALLHAS